MASLALKCQAGLAAARRTNAASIAALPLVHRRQVSTTAVARASSSPSRRANTAAASHSKPRQQQQRGETVVARFKTASDAESRSDASKVGLIARNIVLIVDESEVGVFVCVSQLPSPISDTLTRALRARLCLCDHAGSLYRRLQSCLRA